MFNLKKVVVVGLATYGAWTIATNKITKYWEKEGPFIKARVKRYFVDSLYDAVKRRIDTDKDTDILRNSSKHHKKIVVETVPNDLLKCEFHFKTMYSVACFIRALDDALLDNEEITIDTLIDVYSKFGHSKFVETDICKLDDIRLYYDEDETSFSEMFGFLVYKDTTNDCWVLIFEE